jgi:hypothetical protein
MALIALWILAGVLCIGAVYTVFTAVVLIRDTSDFQKEFQKTHAGSKLMIFNRFWIVLYVILAFIMFSASTTAASIGSDLATEPDRLIFLAIGIFFAGKVIESWAKGRVVFYPQGFVYLKKDIPYTAVQEFKPIGSRIDIVLGKEVVPVSPKLGQEIEKEHALWKENRKKGGSKKKR